MARGFAEEIARAYYRLRGYTVEGDIRLVRPGSRQPSDIDVLAFGDTDVVVVQCKASITQGKTERFVTDTSKWFDDARNHLVHDHARPSLASKYEPTQFKKVVAVTQLHGLNGKKFASVVRELKLADISTLHAVTMLREMRERLLKLRANGRSSFCEWEWGTLVNTLSLMMDIEYARHRTDRHKGSYQTCEVCLLKTLLRSENDRA